VGGVLEPFSIHSYLRFSVKAQRREGVEPQRYKTAGRAALMKISNLTFVWFSGSSFLLQQRMIHEVTRTITTHV
jgi:hypothetical protein